jgi:hypothetical protein
MPEPNHEFTDSDPSTLRVGMLVGGTSIELFGGLAGFVLAILGLAGQSPTRMAALASIVLGGAVFLHGCAILARWDDVMHHLDPNRYDHDAVATGVGVETFAGAVCAVLGILVLVNAVPPGVVAAAGLVLGAGALFGGGAQPQLIEITMHPETPIQELAYRTICAASGVLVVTGIVAASLSVLAIIHVGPPLELTLAADLAIASAMVLAGSALTVRFTSYRLAHQS